MDILGRTCEVKCFLKLVDPWYCLNINVLQWSPQTVFAKIKQFQKKWSCFWAHTHIFTPYTMLLFNYFLAKQSFELTEISRWLLHLSWTVVTNYFPSACFKILSTTLYKCAVLFQSWNYKEWIVFFCGFYWGVNSSKSLTNFTLLILWVIRRSLHSIKSTKIKLIPIVIVEINHDILVEDNHQIEVKLEDNHWS